jgi:hypothetical protein
MSINLSTPITSKFTLLDYLHGRCHIFGYALVKLLEKEKISATGKYIWDSGLSGKLIHCYVQINNDSKGDYDARGIISDETIEEYELDHHGDDIQYYDMPLSELYKDLHDKTFCTPMTNEIEEITDYILNNKSLFNI